MSSRFVSGGAIDGASGEAVALAKSTEPRGHNSSINTRHLAEWETVERELQEERRKRAEAKQAAGSSNGEKSLYEVLEANKAAKQAAFEEAHKLKNQFRPLDEDEVDFLDSVLASTRAEEERVKKETQSGLDKFREEQQRQGTPQETDAVEVTAGVMSSVAGLVHEDALAEGGWHVSSAMGNRKRKRREEKAVSFMGVKRKGGASTDGKQDKETQLDAKKYDRDSKAGQLATEQPQKGQGEDKQLTSGALVVAPKAKLALVDYGSDGNDSDSN